MVDQCFDTIVGVQVRNESINSWTGTFQLSIDGKGAYHKLTCPDCTGATNTMSITADGNADSGSGCLNGRMCALKVRAPQTNIFVHQNMPGSLSNMGHLFSPLFCYHIFGMIN